MIAFRFDVRYSKELIGRIRQKFWHSTIPVMKFAWKTSIANVPRFFPNNQRHTMSPDHRRKSRDESHIRDTRKWNAPIDKCNRLWTENHSATESFHWIVRTGRLTWFDTAEITNCIFVCSKAMKIQERILINCRSKNVF